MGFFSSSKKKEEPKPSAEVKNTPKESNQAAKLNEGKSETPQTEKMDKDKLIRVAATFLSNPNIEKESVELKIAFLKRKGLDDEMIKKAFENYKEKARLELEEKELKEELKAMSPGAEKSAENIAVRIKRAEKSGFLTLKGFNLASIPAEVFSLNNLKTLILSNNPLTEISPEIAKLQELKALHLADCQLTSDMFPIEFGNLKLDELNLAHNMLTEINFLTGIKSLKRLNLMGNEVLELPEELKTLKFLKILNLSKNNISDLTGMLDSLSEVQVLNLTGNPLDEEILKKLNSRVSVVAKTKPLPDQ